MPVWTMEPAEFIRDFEARVEGYAPIPSLQVAGMALPPEAREAIRVLHGEGGGAILIPRTQLWFRFDFPDFCVTLHTRLPAIHSQ